MSAGFRIYDDNGNLVWDLSHGATRVIAVVDSNDKEGELDITESDLGGGTLFSIPILFRNTIQIPLYSAEIGNNGKLQYRKSRDVVLVIGVFT